MKKLILFSAIISFMLETKIIAQVTNGTNTSTFNPEFLGWDNGGVSKSLQIRNDFNQEIHTYTNNLMRMKIMPGGSTFIPLGGQVAFGSNLGAGFTPVDRIHLHQQIVGAITPSFFNGIRMTNNVTGSTNLDGTQIGILDTGAFYIRQYEVAPIIFESPNSRNAGAMTNWFHVSNGLTGFAGDITDGFIGLNEDSAKFHLDIKTPAISNSGSSYGGELFLSCRTSDVPDSRMGMLNIAGVNGIFSPTLFGNMDATQTGSALNTLAVINPSQDLNVNIAPVQRFIVGKDWEYNTNAVDAISELENRNSFSWQNVNSVKMLMNAMGRVEIGTAINLADTITNRLVITSSTLDPGLGLVSTMGGSSGLQFTNLTSATPPDTINPGDGVLAVDTAGNVIYVDVNTLGKLGNQCNSTSNPLISNYEIPLNNKNFLFTDNAGSGQILMGDVSCSNATDSRVYIRNNSTSSSLPYGLKVESNGTGSIGGYFQGANYAGWFNGDVHVNGNITATGTISDQQFKTNIDTIANATNIIQQLNPKTFFFDTISTPQIKFGSERQYGFIAQEVEQVLPELVSNHTFPAQYDSLGNQTSAAINYKGLNYNAFIAILMKGMQDQQEALNNKDSIIDNLETRLAAIEACINKIGICNNNGGGNNNKISSQTVTLENINAIILQQNLPNPFKESTQINYVLPDDVLNAKMLFYDMSGRIINEVNINERGNGTLTVYGENLEKGIYTYSLIADGKLIATKKMVKK
ncbi:MAG: tail fiber domain-containing protein [Vicingaceae bacterium]|nr:tail fiber domain-containing protein [Vicingaceae bacterium]